MRILIVTHSFTPDLTPRAFRWAALAAQFEALGHEVHVLCATPAANEGSEQRRTHRVPDLIMKNRAQNVPGKRETAVPQPRLKRAVKSVIRMAWRWLYWPDYACGWILPAARKAKDLVRQQQFDWVISTSHPFSGHVVCMLAHDARSDTKWLVDIGDPYTHMRDPAPFNRKIYGLFSQWIENRVIDRADRISVTTEATASLYRSGSKASKNKVVVIPPLMSLPDAPVPSTRKGTGLNLVFVGTLYRNLRNPTRMLEALSAFARLYPEEKVRVHFYGAVNDCRDVLDRFMRDQSIEVVVHGLVPRSEVVSAMADADALINIGNNSTSQLASKVVEYMAMGRPILNFVTIEQDISSHTLSDYPSKFTVSTGMGLPAQVQLQDLADFLRNAPEVPEYYRSEIRRAYSSEQIAGQYLALMDEGMAD